MGGKLVFQGRWFEGSGCHGLCVVVVLQVSFIHRMRL